MPINFPDAPSNGQSFGTTPVWQWDGEKWLATTPGIVSVPYLPLVGGTLSNPGNLRIQRPLGGSYIDIFDDGNSHVEASLQLWFNGNTRVPTTFGGVVNISTTSTQASLSLTSTTPSGPARKWALAVPWHATNTADPYYGFGIFDQGTTACLFISFSTHNVGIGTTAPAQRLHVVGNAQVDGTVYSNVVEVAGAYGIINWRDRGSNYLWGWYSNAGYARLWSSSYGDAIRVGQTGYVGLGGGIDPYKPLLVHKAGENDPVEIVTSQNNWCRLRFHQQAIRIWSIGMHQDGTFGIWDESGSAQRFLMRTDGSAYFWNNVDSATAFGAPSYYSNGRLAFTVNASHHQLYRPDGNTALYLSQDTGGTNYYRNQYHRFDNLSASINYMTLDGNVNINSGSLYINSGGVILPNNNAYCVKDTGGTSHPLIWLGANNYCYIANGHNIWVTGQMWHASQDIPNTANYWNSGLNEYGWAGVYAYYFGTVSDRRDKKDIGDLPDNCLDYVRAIVPRRFRWNLGADQETIHWGFIAQEVRVAMGDDFGGVLEGEGEDHKLSLGLTEMLAVLWRAVQELTLKLETRA